jgi:hypothetical protein
MNERVIVQVMWRNLVTVLDGNYYKGFHGSYEDPPEPPEFDITKVMIEGLDVTETISSFFEELEQLAIEKLQEER